MYFIPKKVDEEIYREMKLYLSGLKIGDKVQWGNEKIKYTVKARNHRYIIITKPFNLKNTVLYSIIDLHDMVCAPNDLVFNPYDYSNQKDINKCLIDLEKGTVGLSHRYMANVYDKIIIT